MILCDIGNRNVSFFRDGKIWSITHEEFEELNTDKKIYYICVNSDLSEKLALRDNLY